MIRARRVVGVIVVGLLAAGLTSVAPEAVVAATAGSISRVAGSLGQGAAANLAMTPAAVAVANGRMVITDDRTGTVVGPYDYPRVVRSVDLATGTSSVLAGTGGPGGFSGDGGPGTAADLSTPMGVAVDRAGNVYIADAGNNRVRRVAPNGTITTFAGTGEAGFSGDGGPATAARLSGPTGVEIAPDGSVLVVDYGNARLRRITPAGTISTMAGDKNPLTPPASPPPTPPDVAVGGATVAPDGVIYIFDRATGRLVRRATDGSTTALFGDPSWSRMTLAVEPTGTVLIGDRTSLRRLDPASGRVDLVVGSPDRSGFTGDGGPAKNALLGDLRDIAVGDDGAIYLADRGNLRVRRIAPDGAIQTVAGNGLALHGGDGGPAALAQLAFVFQVKFGPAGTYFTETEGAAFSALETVGADGILRKVTDLQPDVPVGGMAVDRLGYVYLSLGAQVVKISPTGERTVVAGTGQTGSSGDGGPARSAQLSSPGPLAFDGAGNLYIADMNGATSGGGRVRRVDTSGQISAFAGGAPSDRSDKANALVATAAHFNSIDDLMVDSRGSLVVVSGSLWRVTCGVAGRLPGPHLVETGDVAGTTDAMYLKHVFSNAAYSVVRRDAYGRTTTVAGGGTDSHYIGRPATSAELRGSGAFAFDAAGGLLLSTTGGIVRVDGAAPPPPLPGTPCGTVPDHPAWAWGSDVLGQLGDGATVDRFAPPFEDPLVTGAAAVTGGGYHGLALRADGTVWAWGWNGFGQLGDGTNVLRNRPVQVPGLTGVTAIAAGAFDSMALKADGTVWAWGWNGFGQLGDGTTTDRWRPVQVVGLRNVKAISANVVHSLAVTTDGTAWAWGWNGFGLLGDGTTAERHVPGRVLGLTGVTSVAAGYYHSLALTSDGSVWGWGWNAQGQLGNGTTSDAHLPVRALGVSGATAVAAGNNHSVAIVGGKAWSWGWNALDQLGSDSHADRATPAPVAFTAGAYNVVAVAAGAYHTVILLEGNYLVAWGWTQFGQSDYDMQPEHPVAVGAGSYASMAIYQFNP